MKTPLTARIGVIQAVAILCGASVAAWDASAATPPAKKKHASLQTTISVSPVLPKDIPGGAPNATLTKAAFFAWQEFIALNWPAVPQTGKPGTREKADTTQKFGAPDYDGPLAWHTYRGKVEIFPGTGVPPGGTSQVVNGVTVLKRLPNGAGYGYDYPPTYNYQNGAISPASGTPSKSTPWINLDENSQIGLNNIYAGIAAANTGPLGNQILFLAKANRTEFDYIAPKGWWDSSIVPFTATAKYIAKYKKDPRSNPPPGVQQLVSLPSGTVELKSAWRKLAPTEDASRFYTTKVRYYVKGKGGTIQYVDDTLALVGLHIIQKTPTAPYFIFATFEQADNITDANGNPVEDVNGNFIGTPAPATPLTPNIVSNNATATTAQTFTPTTSNVTNAQGQLNYSNVPNQGLTTGTILVNQRQHPMSSEIIVANETAHSVIADYMKNNFPPNTTSPWAYYKLISVQWRPIAGKVPGQTYTEKNAATYYQANSTIETDYNLQVFSGQFFPGLPNYPQQQYANTITDYNSDGTPFKNVAYNSRDYNMGGCMGCHGNAQHGGADFSFILLGGRVLNPDTTGPTTSDQLEKFQKYFGHP